MVIDRPPRGEPINGGVVAPPDRGESTVFGGFLFYCALPADGMPSSGRMIGGERMRDKNPRTDKVQTVAELETIFRQSAAAILTEYRGLTVAEITHLRNKLRESGGEYHVVKNTLFKKALGGELTPDLENLLSGPTAVAFAREDAVATAKVVLDFIRETKKPDIIVKGGYMSGKVFSPDQVIALSKIPPKPVVLSQAVGAIQGPLSGFAGTMNGVLGEFVRTLQALSDKMQNEGAQAA
jgi:large subunit ribosomal protein L10